jgi:hypothetical protein
MLILAATVFSAACSGNSAKAEHVTIKTHQNITGKQISIDAQKGSAWSHKQSFGIISINIVPQFAIWIEDTQGNYLETLYVTKKYAIQDWPYAKYEKDKPFRISSMPYWRNKRLKKTKSPVTNKTPLPDTMTGATPGGDFTLKSKIEKLHTKVIIKAEFNKSFDTNSFYNSKRDASKINGQPSVIFSSDVINLKKPKQSYKMKFIGHGGETGKDKKLYKNTKNLSTALKIIKTIKIAIANN